MFAIRLTAFIISVLLATEEITPQWEWFAAVAVLGFLSVRDIYGVALIVLASLLAFEVVDPEQAWLIVMSVLSGLGVARSLGLYPHNPRSPYFWRDQHRLLNRIWLRPGASYRLRRWSRISDY
jgi:hypothetical protein